MGAENGVTAAELVLTVVRGVTELGIGLREHGGLGHCQYSCHYDWLIWHCSACSAALGGQCVRARVKSFSFTSGCRRARRFPCSCLAQA